MIERMARRSSSFARRSAAHLAVLGLLVHALLLAFHVPGSGLVPADRDDAVALLFAGGMPICTSQGAQTLVLDEGGLGASDAPVERDGGGRAASCPVCTALGAGSFAPPVSIVVLAAPEANGLRDRFQGRAPAPDLSVDVYRNRGPPRGAVA